MGASLRNHDEEFDDQPMSEINVTPLVDVMLVLLIVFMVAAPLMTSGVPVDLPKTQAKQLNDQKPPLAVSVDGAGRTFIGSDEVTTENLLSTLLNHAENELERRIHVRADKNLPYKTVLEVMGQINAAGFTKVALVSETPPAPVAGGAAGATAAPQAAPGTSVAPAAPAAPGSSTSAAPTTSAPAVASVGAPAPAQ